MTTHISFGIKLQPTRTDFLRKKSNQTFSRGDLTGRLLRQLSEGVARSNRVHGSISSWIVFFLFALDAKSYNFELKSNLLFVILLGM